MGILDGYFFIHNVYTNHLKKIKAFLFSEAPMTFDHAREQNEMSPCSTEQLDYWLSDKKTALFQLFSTIGGCMGTACGFKIFVCPVCACVFLYRGKWPEVLGMIAFCVIFYWKLHREQESTAFSCSYRMWKSNAVMCSCCVMLPYHKVYQNTKFPFALKV